MINQRSQKLKMAEKRETWAEKLPGLLVLLAECCVLLPMVQFRFGSMVGLAVMFAAWVGLLFVMNPYPLRLLGDAIRAYRRVYLGLFVVSGIVAFDLISRRGSDVQISAFLFQIGLIVIMETVSEGLNPAQATWTRKLLLLAIAINVAYSMPYIVTHLHAVKMQTGGLGSLQDDSWYQEAGRSGVGSSLYYQGMAIIVPALLGRWLDKKLFKSNALSAFCLLSLMIGVLLSESVAAILVMILGCLLILSVVFFQSRRGRYQLSVAALLVVPTLIVLVIKFADEIQIVGPFLLRTMEISEAATSGQGPSDDSVNERGGLIRISFDTFKANPLFGIGVHTGKDSMLPNGEGNGNHSSIFDLLAMFGIAGAAFWLLIYQDLVARGWRRAKKVAGSNERIGIKVSLATFLLSAFSNPSLIDFQLVPLAYLFLFAYYPENLQCQ